MLSFDEFERELRTLQTCSDILPRLNRVGFTAPAVIMMPLSANCYPNHTQARLRLLDLLNLDPQIPMAKQITIAFRGTEYQATCSVLQLAPLVSLFLGETVHPNAILARLTRGMREEIAASLSEAIPTLPDDVVSYRRTESGVEYKLDLEIQELTELAVALVRGVQNS